MNTIEVITQRRRAVPFGWHPEAWAIWLARVAAAAGGDVNRECSDSAVEACSDTLGFARGEICGGPCGTGAADELCTAGACLGEVDKGSAGGGLHLRDYEWRQKNPGPRSQRLSLFSPKKVDEATQRCTGNGPLCSDLVFPPLDGC